MMKSVAIYLAGSIQKGHESGNELYWTEAHMSELTRALEPRELCFLNPAFRTDDLQDARAVFGRDMMQVFSADFIIVDARDRRGLGVGAEMMWAKFHNIPVITWAPPETNYNKSETTLLGVTVKNYIHPFVESLSDKVALTLLDAALFIEKALINPTFEPKGVAQIMQAMEHYLTKGLPRDLPMLEILRQNPSIKEKIDQLAGAARM
jgi:hypothetical protein